MLFSLVCLTYKRSELLEECVYSILQQTYKNWELLIINDCDVQTINFNHPQIRIFNLKEKFKSISDKRNFGKSNISGDWIMSVDDDDFLLPDYLQNITEIIDKFKADWISCQRPILYYSSKKIYLSPVPQTNTFFYTKNTSKNFFYESSGKDELNPFYSKTMIHSRGKKVLTSLKPEKCGYVWRRADEELRKYALADIFSTKSTEEEQDVLLKSIKCPVGVIDLNPKWSKDYVDIIKSNLKIIPAQYAYKNIKGSEEIFNIVQNVLKDKSNKIPDPSSKLIKNIQESSNNVISTQNNWKLVKPSWDKAIKFLEAIRSRGIISTALDVVGINKSYGERISEEILRRRKQSCFGNEIKGIAPCQRLKFIKQKGYFCGECGCGDRELARLDSTFPGGYTKLHYPYLECPLRKRGFINELTPEYIKISNKTPLSIIIPVLNDNVELNFTIESIRDTSPLNVEIIVIDDKSDNPVVVNDKTVKIIRLEERLGVGATRHIGATNATSDYLLFIDSHMRFDPSWYNNIMTRLISNLPKIVWCATCLGLDEECMDINNPKGLYHGARLALYEEKENQVFEGKWDLEKVGTEYEISCLMGACYFFHKSWFFHIGGTKSLKMWGSDEPLLSAKTLLAGGIIKLVKDVRIGHKFRSAASYGTDPVYIIYNKLRSIKMLFSNFLYEELKFKIPNDDSKIRALEMLERDSKEIEKEKQYYRTIFTRDEKWLCETYSVGI